MASFPRATILARVAIALASFAASSHAEVIQLVPTGTAADVTNLVGALGGATDGDIIVLRARDAQGDYRSFDFSTMTSSEFVVSAANVTVSGEGDLRMSRARTRVLGPTVHSLAGSFVAFDVQDSADGFMVTGIEFRRFEAVMLLRAGAKNVSFVDCIVVNCANGVFGQGDNDGLRVAGCSIRVSATPVGGNAGVTVQEGSDDLHVADSIFIGPGVSSSPLAAAGIIDFNLETGASRLSAFGNEIQRFDVGIFASGANPRLVRNTISRCGDGIAAISEISTGSVPGTLTVTNAFIRNNSSRHNLDDGIHLVGVGSALVAFNVLMPNAGAGLTCESASPSTPTVGIVSAGNAGSQSCGGGLSVDSGVTRREVRPDRP